MTTEIEIGAETSAAQEAPAIRSPPSGKRTRRADNSIFRAPAHMRYDRINDIEPKFVSIGPYHHGREKLKPMEELKRECVPYGPYLEKKQPVGECMEFKRDARLFYKEKMDHISDDDFVEMLVRDSCFIIRVILSVSQEVQESMAFLDVNIKEVRSDLLLLENQIPLFFIRKVYDSVFSGRPPFETVLERFICLDMPWSINRDGMSSKAAHLLDLYWRCSTSETLNHYGSYFEVLINNPLNNLQSGYVQARNELLNNTERPLIGDMREEMNKLIDDKIKEMNELIGYFDLGSKQLMMNLFEPLGFHKQTVDVFETMIDDTLSKFRNGLKEMVMKQLFIYRDKEISNFQDGFEQAVIEQLITFRSDFQKAIDEQRDLIHKACCRRWTRMAQRNSFGCCLEQGRNEQPNNIESDIKKEMNEQLNFLSIGFDQMINKQLNNLGRPCFQGEQPSFSLVEQFCPSNAPKVIVNAIELHQKAGITFGKLNNEHPHDGPDVIFTNGIMQMPYLKIDSCQKTLLVNLIAYENSKLPSMRTFSSYIKLMDALIDSEKDVELLQQCGVISNTLSSHKMAATFFNDIGNFCLIDNKSNCFSDLYENVPKYYESSWNRSCANLRQNYCSSGWARLSVAAGVTLLILSVGQTFYTIYGYYRPMN